jgi:hypothetical protein
MEAKPNNGDYYKTGRKKTGKYRKNHLVNKNYII